MIEIPNLALSSAIDKLVEIILPKKIVKGLVLELGIILRENGLKFNELANFLQVTDKWYGHLYPGGLEQYEAFQDARLRIAHVTHGPCGLIISKNISKASDAQKLLILWLLLKHLHQLKNLQSNGLKESEKNLLDLQNPLPVKELKQQIELCLASEERLKPFPLKGIKKLSDFLCTLYFREHKSLNTAIQFSKENIMNIRLKIQAPMIKKSMSLARISAKQTIAARFIQGEDEYETQLIEYSENGNGISLFISETSNDDEKRLKKKTNDIVVIIGQKKLRGLLMHITEKEAGLLLGIQLRYPIRNWSTFFKL